MLRPIIWSKTTRVLHWGIALPVAINFFAGGGEMPHKILGYVSLVVLLIRLFWGFRSQDHANFKSFPLALGEIKKSYSVSYPGHNPIASWVYILIWICVLLLGVTGFMMGLDAFWGEDWLEKLHGQISTFLSMLVIGHLIGLIGDSIKYKRKTWLGMITGRRS